MLKHLKTLRFWFLVGIVVLGIVARLIPHLPNFTPVVAIALFAAAYFPNKGYSFLVPIGVMLLSDIGLELMGQTGIYSGMWVVYLTLALVVVIGFYLRDNVNFGTVLGTTLVGSIVFFLITNFASWLSLPRYTKDLAGLIECYTAAIPFFRSSLAGNFTYVLILFGAYDLAKSYYPQLTWQEARA